MASKNTLSSPTSQVEPTIPQSQSAELAESENSIIEDASWYTAATYLAQFVSFFAGLLTKRFLGPTNLGIWRLLNIMLRYLSVAQVGTSDAVGRQMPYLSQKGEVEYSERLKGTMFSFTVGLAVIAGLMLIVGAPVWADRSFEFRVGALIIALLFPLWQLQNGQIVVFRANKEFVQLSKALLLKVGINASIVILLVWKFGIYGQYAAFVILLISQVGYYLYHSQNRPNLGVRFEFRLDDLRTLLRIGTPLQLAGLITTLQMTLDSLIVARFLGVTAVGYYALALTIQNYVYESPRAFSVVMFPRFQERYAASADDPQAVLDYMKKPLLGLSCFLLPILIAASYFFGPALIRQLLPDFEPSIPVIQILLAGTFFLGLGHMPAQYLITIDRLWSQAGLLLVTTGFIAGFCFLAATVIGTIQSIAVAVSLANALGLTVTLMFALRYAGAPKQEVIYVLGQVLGAFTYLYMVLVAIDRLVQLPSASGLAFDFGLAGFKTLTALAILSPMFLYANRRLSLGRRLSTPIKVRLGRLGWLRRPGS